MLRRCLLDELHVVFVFVGINEARFDDGHYLPHHQGFDYVGTILPFTLAWGCDTSKVSHEA
jgi:hypothetical protein